MIEPRLAQLQSGERPLQQRGVERGARLYRIARRQPGIARLCIEPSGIVGLRKLRGACGGAIYLR